MSEAIATATMPKITMQKILDLAEGSATGCRVRPSSACVSATRAAALRQARSSRFMKAARSLPASSEPGLQLVTRPRLQPDFNCTLDHSGVESQRREARKCKHDSVTSESGC